MRTPPCTDLPRDMVTSLLLGSPPWIAKKTDVSEHPWVFGHVGLLANRHPPKGGLPFN